MNETRLRIDRHWHDAVAAVALDRLEGIERIVAIRGNELVLVAQTTEVRVTYDVREPTFLVWLSGVEASKSLCVDLRDIVHPASIEVVPPSRSSAELVLVELRSTSQERLWTDLAGVLSVVDARVRGRSPQPVPVPYPDSPAADARCLARAAGPHDRWWRRRPMARAFRMSTRSGRVVVTAPSVAELWVVCLEPSDAPRRGRHADIRWVPREIAARTELVTLAGARGSVTSAGLPVPALREVLTSLDE